MTSLADKSLLSGGDNKPPMLEKHLYDSWKSRMELYMMNRPHERMIIASVEKGPLVWPSITEDGVTRLKDQHRVAKDLWEKIKLLMQGTSLTKQERECKDKKNRLMRIDELHKFSDGTLDDVRTVLNDRLKGIRMEYLPKTFWSQRDKANVRAMIQAIDKRLKTRRIMRSLERFVGGRPYGGDLRLLQRTI
ncbi:hypothetical protein Tco_0734968 [Tanacetum coccineum]